MFKRMNLLNCLLPALLLLSASALYPQLDPRLQAGNTDFLDLYQKTSTLRPKPEIVSIFDYSGSMDWLIFHPIYQNFELTDSTTRTLSVTISMASSGAISNVTISNINVSLSGQSNTQLTLTFRNLVKPDGSVVTAQDAENCRGVTSKNGTVIVAPSSNGMYTGTGTANRDIRHWLMAASHIRLQCTAAQSAVSGTLNRTIDIPLPWKIMDMRSTGNPLSSMTIKDKQEKTDIDDNGRPKTTVYGSGLDIEFDLSYKIPIKYNNTSNNFGIWPVASNRLSVNLTGVGTVSLYYIHYIHWLFNGKYQGAKSRVDSNATCEDYPTNGSYYTNDPSLAGKFIVFDSMAPNGSSLLAAGQDTADWGKGFRGQIHNPSTHKRIKMPRYDLEFNYIDTVEDYAYKHHIPGFTRLQAVKYAAIQTWIKNQADVYWAFRLLDPQVEANNNPTSINNSSKEGLFASDPLVTETHPLMASASAGKPSAWVILNNTPTQGINSTTGNSVKGMERIAATFGRGGTPLTYSLARTLAQYSDPNNVFNDVYEPGESVPQCSNAFIILFTDGIDNGGTISAETPYVTNTNLGANATYDIIQGNRTVIANRTRVDRSSTYWNSFTFAAMGAHLYNPAYGVQGVEWLEALDHGKPGAATKSGTPSSFMPYAVKARKGETYTKPKRITTMTVGISLGGKYTQAGPKRAWFLAAVLGDPNITPLSGRVGSFRSFSPPTYNPDGSVDQYNDWLADPANPDAWPAIGKRKDGAAYFFDTSNPDALTAAIETAFNVAISAATNNSTSNPNLPFIGASLGAQVYMGSFNTPEGGGVNWTGDLRMFGIREEDGNVRMTNNKGDVAETLDVENAVWATSTALREKPWRSRRLFTRLPGAKDGDPLTDFKDTGDVFSNAAKGLARHIDTGFDDEDSHLAAAARIVRFAAGGDTVRGPFDADGRPTANRNTIMGDIINSSPAAIEYAFDKVQGSLGNYTRLSGVNGDRFRLILVGTNQGWLHAFGEVTRVATVTDSKNVQRNIVTGNVEELWSFMPTDFLKYLNYITHPGNSHRAMVDGSPAIYHLDLPASGGAGNGVIDNGERAVAVFGLGKGGRSYYALNIEDPFNPKIQWTLIPDEASNTVVFPDSRATESGLGANDVRGMISRWGFSTATPAFGRVVLERGSGRRLRDAVFLSGGFSVPEIDARFPDSNGSPTRLGRSIMALDVYTGSVIAAHDLSNDSAAGPITSGLIPFEFIVNSGAAQRAYFTDYNGGLWAWGSGEVSQENPYRNYRKDTSDINKWQLRKVFQDDTVGRRYTTPPAPFRIGSFPARPRAAGSPIPAAVGIAMISGDRNNPLDYGYSGQNAAPANPRLTVVFDRQDGPAWSNATGIVSGAITNNALVDFTANVATSVSQAQNPCSDSVFRRITPSCDDYYLAPSNGDPKFGYYINFLPAMENGFIPKGINPPVVVANSLYYTIFKPASADPCAGGFGLSESWVIGDALNPLKDDKRNTLMAASGLANTWGGVASDYIPLGTRGVIQGGVAAGSADATIQGTPEIRTTATNPSQGYPKPRVWRVVR